MSTLRHSPTGDFCPSIYDNQSMGATAHRLMGEVGSTNGRSGPFDERHDALVRTTSRAAALRTHVRPWRLRDTGRVRLHHRWDDEDRPEPDLTEPATAAALTRAARDVHIVKLVHLALLVLGIGLLALALLLRLG